MKTVTIYTDGACSGNPGPGGWGAILEWNGVEKEISGGAADTTNNRMELIGVIEALSLLKEPCVVELYSDSKYVIDALQKGWVYGWQKRAGSRATKSRHRTWISGSGFCPWSLGTSCAATGSKVTPKTKRTTAATSWPWPKVGNSEECSQKVHAEFMILPYLQSNISAYKEPFQK